MTHHKIQFCNLIKQSSVSGFILKFFDETSCSFDVEKAEKSFFGASSGEEFMLKFFINVSLARDCYQLELIDNSHRLDNRNRDVISGWFSKPFYP